MNSKISSIFNIRNTSKRLFSRSSRLNVICPPPPPKKSCDYCPPPDRHKDCRDVSVSCKQPTKKPAVDHEHAHHENSRMKWRFITLFIALPLVLSCSITTYLGEEEETERPPFVEYEYMYRRIKPYPWGDGMKTIFHNPCKNAVPKIGYEDDKCPERKSKSDEDED